MTDKKTILIVEDEKDLIEILEITLKKEGYEVLSALDGVSGLDLVNVKKPDLVILDVMMPGMDGYEVCKKIKADPHTRHIPVLMLTALMKDAQGYQAGADAYMIKAYGSTQDILFKISELLMKTSSKP